MLRRHPGRLRRELRQGQQAEMTSPVWRQILTPLLSCADDNQDKICDTNRPPCSSEGIAYAGLFTTYCTANSSESVCHS